MRETVQNHIQKDRISPSNIWIANVELLTDSPFHLDPRHVRCDLHVPRLFSPVGYDCSRPLILSHSFRLVHASSHIHVLICRSFSSSLPFQSAFSVLRETQFVSDRLRSISTFTLAGHEGFRQQRHIARMDEVASGARMRSLLIPCSDDSRSLPPLPHRWLPL
jgi:hypothetical protein